MATILPATEENLLHAVKVLRADGVVAIPTETVYGLAGRTMSVRAVTEIHRLKGRPADNPLIAHVLSEAEAQHVTAGWDRNLSCLAQALWPGPLTMITGKGAKVPKEATGGRDTIAVRAPRHPVARRLLELMNGEALSAPSANMSGKVSPTTAQHVQQDFAHVTELLILDGGACEVGIESTVVDMVNNAAVVLRPGSVTVDQISKALGFRAQLRSEAQQGASPGTSAVHYAPHTPAMLVPRTQMQAHLASQTQPCVVLMIIPPTGIPDSVRGHHEVLPMPGSPAQYAAVLYDRLRQADALKCAQIVIQEPAPAADHEWVAVRDRLTRATVTASES